MLININPQLGLFGLMHSLCSLKALMADGDPVQSQPSVLLSVLPAPDEHMPLSTLILPLL